MPGLCSHLDLRGLWGAEALYVGPVEQFHRSQIHLSRFQYQIDQTSKIKVDVCQSGEQAFGQESIDLFVSIPQFPGMVSVGGDPFQSYQQGILEAGHILILAAHAGLGAPGPVSCLLTLVTKHAVPLPFFSITQIMNMLAPYWIYLVYFAVCGTANPI